MHTEYDSKGKVVKSVEQMRRELDRELEGRVGADGRPAWWTDDDDAVRSSIAMARHLGLNVPAMGT